MITPYEMTGASNTCIIGLNVVEDANFESLYLQRTSCTYPEDISHIKMLLFSTEVFVSDMYHVNVPLIYTIFT
jgi:hypothetical protein